MVNRNVIAGGICALLLVACGGATVTKEIASKADFGPRPSDKTAHSAIKEHLEQTLLDPESMRLKCSSINKGWAREHIFAPPTFGYLIICDVNAKNRMGGYVGAKEYAFVINRSTLSTFGTSASEIKRGMHYDLVE